MGFFLFVLCMLSITFRKYFPLASRFTVRRILVGELAKGFESREVLPLALKYTFGRRADKKHVPVLHLFHLGPDADRPVASGAEDNTRPLDGLEGGFCAFRLEIGLHDAELLDGWVVEDGGRGGRIGGGVEGHVGVIGRGHFLLRDGGVRVG